jgi:hypothetical protein
LLHTDDTFGFQSFIAQNPHTSSRPEFHTTPIPIDYFTHPIQEEDDDDDDDEAEVEEAPVQRPPRRIRRKRCGTGGHI